MPVFLSRCPQYARYLTEVPAGELTLTPYEQLTDPVSMIIPKNYLLVHQYGPNAIRVYYA